MGKITDVSIINATTIRLETDAKKGDEIDLRSINKVDDSIILEKINKKTDEIYNAKLLEAKKAFDIQKENAILVERNKLSDTIAKLETQLETIKKDTKNEMELIFQKEKNELENKINSLKSENEKKDNEYELKLNKKSSDYDKLINELKEEINTLKGKQENHEKDIELAVSKKEIELQEIISNKDNEINNLKLAKSNMNVKRLGEQLEKWCNNEYESHALVGFQNCTWIKDNISIKDEDETSGSKADYIFKVYASNEKKENELISCVVCEMKNEDPNSKNKKKNSDHFSKLDKDRKKKNGEYALLVSELEWDSDNDVPIKKVADYDKMYIVRPQYFITFLSIVENLGSKFKDLIIQENKEIENFKASQTIIDEFDKMRKEILDGQLVKLNKEATELIKNAQSIKDISDKIIVSANKITDNYVRTISKKIENYNITKTVKKIDKLNATK